MRCTNARELMLTAEPYQLRSEDESPLSTHLRSCAQCRTAALAADDAVTLLRAALQTRPAIASPVKVRWTGRRVASVALPIAAALIAALVLRGGDEATTTPAVPSSVRRAVVSVDVAPGQVATVLKTRDPKVTIVWLAPGGGL